MFRILVAEDDDSARFLMCEVLRRAGYEPCPARDGVEALEVMEHYQCDLAVVDITMPRMDGITFTRTLREGNCDLPVLMVTARVTQEDKRRGFRAGTDDYMVKPVDEEEMLWRIEALLRRYCSRADRRLTVGATVLDRGSLQVITPQGTWQLAAKEFLLLYKLLSYPRTLFTKRQLTGEKYRNNHRLAATTYWTYATIHRILQNEMYIGNMEQGRDDRLQMHGKARRKERSLWTVVSGTHEPIIEKDQWRRVQTLLNANARTPDFQQNVSPFAGFLRCGDCGRAMVKTTWGGKTFYTCGSYKRCGASVCSKHYIAHDALTKVILDDLNQLIAGVENLRQLAQQGAAKRPRPDADQPQKLEAALQRVQRRRRSAYEDYQDALISKEDYLRCRADYDAQEQALQTQLDKLHSMAQDDPLALPWVKELLASGRLTELDRPTVAAAIREIRVYEGNRVEIDYLFPESYRALLEGR